MQAASGWVNVRDPDRPPVQAGARISEYVAGWLRRAGCAHRAENAPADAAYRRGRRLGDGVAAVDASVSDADGRADAQARACRPTLRQAPMLGIVRAADGWIGINCLTGQHWLDVCAMLGLPEYGEHQIAIMLGGPERAEFFEKAQPWLSERTVDEIVELSQAMRIPAHSRQRRCDGAWSVRSTAIAGSSSRPGATTGRSVALAPRSGCRRPRPCRFGPHPASADRQRPLRRHGRMTPSAGAIRACRSTDVKVLDLSHVLGGRLPHLLSRCVRRRHHQGGIDPTPRRVSLLRAHAPTRATGGTSAAGCGRRPT